MTDKNKRDEEQIAQDVKLEDLKPGDVETEQVKGGRISLVDQPS